MMSQVTDYLNAKINWRLDRRQAQILVGLLVINLAIFGGMWLLSRGNRSAATARALVTGETLPLEEAYRQALGTALEWQPDAQLTSVTTSWQVASGDRLTLERSAWSFQFYSPQVGRVQLVNVDRVGAQTGPQQPVGIAPGQVIPDWKLDSGELLMTFLSYGGQAFMGSHPRANVHVQLKAASDDRPLWYVTAVDPVARETYSIEIDARTRQVITSEAE
jgi:hypothetical protein